MIILEEDPQTEDPQTEENHRMVLNKYSSSNSRNFQHSTIFVIKVK